VHKRFFKEQGSGVSSGMPDFYSSIFSQDKFKKGIAIKR
jgi:hypothetical protein